MRQLISVFVVVLAAGLAGPAFADDCIDVALGAEKIPGDPLDRLQLTYALHNCGDAGLATVTFSLTKDGSLVGEIGAQRHLQADQGFELELLLPIPRIVPPGEYQLCAGASLGTATDSECALVVLDAAGNVLSFTAEFPLPVTDVDWGTVKQLYRQ